MVVPSAETDFVSDFRRYTYHLHLYFLHLQNGVQRYLLLMLWFILVQSTSCGALHGRSQSEWTVCGLRHPVSEDGNRRGSGRVPHHETSEETASSLYQFSGKYS